MRGKVSGLMCFLHLKTGIQIRSESERSSCMTSCDVPFTRRFTLNSRAALKNRAEQIINHYKEELGYVGKKR